MCICMMTSYWIKTLEISRRKSSLQVFCGFVKFESFVASRAEPSALIGFLAKNYEGAAQTHTLAHSRVVCRFCFSIVPSRLAFRAVVHYVRWHLAVGLFWINLSSELFCSTFRLLLTALFRRSIEGSIIDQLRIVISSPPLWLVHREAAGSVLGHAHPDGWTNGIRRRRSWAAVAAGWGRALFHPRTPRWWPHHLPAWDWPLTSWPSQRISNSDRKSKVTGWWMNKD